MDREKAEKIATSPGSLNIMIVGVGGQGTLLASRILGAAALKRNYDVKVSEVHGMSQRGGSVVTYVKMGTKVHSPLIEKGEADIIIAFEQLEALRWAEYLADGGRIIVNTQRIDPMPVITGKAKYPENIRAWMEVHYGNCIFIDALELAKACGNAKTANTVIVGQLARFTGIPQGIWLEAIGETVPEKSLAVNIKAFERGYDFIAEDKA